MAALSVLSVASEVFPLVKTGGLADVAGALPAALAGEGVSVRSLLPLYPAVAAKIKRAQVVHQWPAFYGGPARLLAAKASGLDLLLLDCPHLYDRPGNPYTGPDGRDWPDNAIRFAALARAAASIGQGLLKKYTPAIIHCHDWQAGLTPAFLHYDGGNRPRTVMTVHNLAFQGQFPRAALPAIGLPERAYVYDGVEYYGTIGYLKAGLQLADRITTVSPNYAAEITSPDAGMGLDGLLTARRRDVTGIINGIDTDVWNPATDDTLATDYNADTLDRRRLNKAGLQQRLGLAPGDKPLLFGIVSRLSWQKGIDLVLAALPTLMGMNAELAVLGAGDAELEAGLRAAALRYPGRIACHFGYDEGLAHQIQAGCDALLVPSRFEPCGLTQLCALRYGAIPVVSRVGGLADTVIDANEMALANGVATGVQFAPVTSEALAGALHKVAALFAYAEGWRRLQRNGMKTDVSWAGPARRYAELYRQLLSPGT
jgi:starch synthase